MDVERNGENFEMMRSKKQWDLEMAMDGSMEQKGAKHNSGGKLREHH